MHSGVLGRATLTVSALALTSLTFVGTAAATSAPPGPSPQIQQILDSDDTANLDDNGHLYYVDPAPKPPAGYVPAPQKAPSSTSAAGLAIPPLSSRSSSTHTIYLDFDGVNLPGTSGWATAGANPIAAGAYTGFTLDGSSDFTQAEVDYIQKVWRIVSEKYSPFDVNVTTVDPGQAALTRTNVGDNAYGVQVVITNDASPVNQVCSGNCAGIAYVDLFDGRQLSGTPFNDVDYTVAWVFSSKTFNSPQVTALDASHEVGHTMGLAHDGDASHPDYYLGHANWVPIMGITNQNAVSQFNNGDYLGANNQQDDLAIIGANDQNANGSFLLADDYGNTGAAPAALGDQTSYALDGIISSAADDDLFSIQRTCTTPLTATATGIGAGQAVDLKVDILDNTNSVLASNDPASGQNYVGAPSIAFEPTGLDAAATVPAPSAGTTYRIRVDGVGSGDPMAQTGYSAYGSIGQYHLTISGCPAAPATVPGPPATASATPNARSATGTVNWTAPSADGGSAVIGYRITGLPEGTVNLGNVLSYGASSLVPGTTYNLAVFAVNSIGFSATSANTTLKVDTWAPTAKPGINASLSGSTATVSWTAPNNPGGATLTGWHVVATGASPVDETLAATTLTKDYAVSYGTTTFHVTGVYTATDIAGVTASSLIGVTRATELPGAPSNIVLSPGFRDPSADIQWTAPSSDGGSAITGYEITGLPGGTVNTTGTGTAYDAFNLDPGVTYPITIKAKNAIGTSATGATANLKVNTWAPTAKPGLTAALASSTATVTWTAPANPGNATLTGWHVVATGASPVDETLAAGTLTKNYTVVAGTTTYTVTGVYTADDLTGVKTSDAQGVTRAAGPIAPGAPAGASAAQIPRTNSGTITWTAPTSTGGSAVTGYIVSGLPGGTVNLGNVLTYTADNLTPGTTYDVGVQAQNAIGAGATTTTTLFIGTWAPTAKPVLTVTRSGTSAVIKWTAPVNTGGATLTGWHLDRTGPGMLPADKDLPATVMNNTTTMAGLSVGTHSFTITPIYTADDVSGVRASDPKTLVIATKPTAPKIGTAVSGAAGGAKNATAKWAAPSSTGGAAITSYKVIAYKISKGNVVATRTSGALGATARSYVYALPAGTYKFRVVAYNSEGASPPSGYSKVVTSR